MLSRLTARFLYDAWLLDLIILIQCLLKQSYSDMKAAELGEELEQIVAILVNHIFVSSATLSLSDF